jgi:hypothetical protein
MAKYYISSANVNMIVQAADPQGAALWAIHQVLEASDDTSTRTHSDENPLLDWDETILVSERGHGQHEAGCFSTEQTVQRYVELVTALERLAERHFAQDTP